ncbi:glycosyltransferase family A protein [Thiopseudomonas alkaliphila]|uniref:glycosyltransferase family A protein n=1 Tax=Thiopseudomonas alkaliphila TaxID=1697053 RepID=UPI002575063D|nr:glycosyltransferase family 2 protein [Thiopseudomonas alkaliphila]MDM1706951.1 glycosyltransferase family 2 protein [Thiopseudomonas alkaliphila]
MSKLAVLIPTYKPAAYLESCLEMLDKQDLSKRFYKVYVALNGTKEKYEEYVLNVLGKFDFDYEYLYLEKAGVSNARNKLIEISTEEFIVFIDDDDLISASYLSELLKVSGETTIGISNVKNFVVDMITLKENYIGCTFSKIRDVEPSKYRSRKYYSSPWGKMIHRNIIADTRFDTNLAIGEDSLFMAKLSYRVNLMKKTSKMACYYVREREGSATRKKIKRKKELKRICYLLKEYSKMLFLPHYERLFITTRIVATLMHGRRLFK